MLGNYCSKVFMSYNAYYNKKKRNTYFRYLKGMIRGTF